MLIEIDDKTIYNSETGITINFFHRVLGDTAQDTVILDGAYPDDAPEEFYGKLADDAWNKLCEVARLQLLALQRQAEGKDA